MEYEIKVSEVEDLSKEDFAFLASFGDTDVGFVARGEWAEMSNILSEKIDQEILSFLGVREVWKMT